MSGSSLTHKRQQQRCVRAWELAAEKGFENSAAGFDKFCSAAAVP